MSLSVMYSMTAVLLLQKDLILYEVTLNDVFPSICLYALLARQFNFKLEGCETFRLFLLLGLRGDEGLPPLL